jgi:hypothetical protein
VALGAWLLGSLQSSYITDETSWANSGNMHSSLRADKACGAPQTVTLTLLRLVRATRTKGVVVVVLSRAVSTSMTEEGVSVFMNWTVATRGTVSYELKSLAVVGKVKTIVGHLHVNVTYFIFSDSSRVPVLKVRP